MTTSNHSLPRTFRRGTPLLYIAVTLLVSACTSDDQPQGDPEPEEQHGVVALTATQWDAADIDTFTTTLRRLTVPMTTSAVIEAVPDRTAILAARVDGRVTGVFVNAGDRVAAGALLATVDAPELGQAKASYLAALAEERVTGDAVDREKRLLAEQIVSTMVVQAAEGAAIRARAVRDAAEARLHILGLSDEDLKALRSEQHFSSLVELRAPLSGIVIQRRAIVGGAVSPTDSLFVIVDPSVVWAQLDVYDTQLPHVALGQPVHVRIASDSATTFTGRVDNIGIIVEPTSRATKVRVVLANPKLLLKPGMFANAQIETGGTSVDAAPVIGVPRSAVQRDGTDQVVFVMIAPGRFERRVVRVALMGGEWVEVQSGLTVGEIVVIRGAFALKAELRRGELAGDDH